MQLSLKFRFKNETKGTYRYEEVHSDDVPPAVGALYIRKYALEGKTRPEMVEVMITDEQDSEDTGTSL